MSAAAVVARFYVASYSRHAPDPDSAVVKMQAVSRGEHNKNWAKWTPAANVELNCYAAADAEYFVSRLGKELAVVFSDGIPVVPPEESIQILFKVAGYQAQAGDNGAVLVTLSTVAAYGNSGKLPVGSIQMTIKNPGAADFFIQGLGHEVTAAFAPAGSED